MNNHVKQKIMCLLKQGGLEMPDDIHNKHTDIIYNSTSPTIFVDNLTIETRSDGNHLLRFLIFLPEGFKEEARLMVPNESLKTMLKILNKQCDMHNNTEKKKQMKKTQQSDVSA